MAVIVTATPPTPNGDLHVGHLAGPYFAADVYARHQRQLGNDVVYLSSGDDHQSYVVDTARRKEMDPLALADAGNRDIRATLAAAEIAIDVFNRPDAAHRAFVTAFMTRLYQSGKFSVRMSPVWRDRRTGERLFEAHVVGYCPNCLLPTKGGICESCGHPNTIGDLLHRRPVGGHPDDIEQTQEPVLWFPIEPYRKRIAAFLEERRDLLRPRIADLVRTLMEKPLADFQMSFVSDWGIPVPFAGLQGNVFNVWAEMLPGLMHSTSLCPGVQQDGLASWDADSGNRLVQFLGYDNSYFFIIVHLALLCAADEDLLLPEAIVTNEFYQLEGAKFSTSQNHVIWGRDLLKTHTVDAARFYMALTNPETQQTDFRLDAMESTIRERVIAPYERLRRKLSAGASAISGETAGPSQAVIALAGRLEQSYALERFSLARSAQDICGFLAYLDETVPAEPDATERRMLWDAVAALSVFAAPLVPGFAGRLAEATGLEDDSNWHRWRYGARNAITPEKLPAFTLRRAGTL